MCNIIYLTASKTKEKKEQKINGANNKWGRKINLLNFYNMLNLNEYSRLKWEQDAAHVSPVL